MLSVGTTCWGRKRDVGGTYGEDMHEGRWGVRVDGYKKVMGELQEV